MSTFGEASRRDEVEAFLCLITLIPECPPPRPPRIHRRPTGRHRGRGDQRQAPPQRRSPRCAFSANTERALRGDIARFTGWCAEAGQRAMPASQETVAAFIDVLAASKAPATVRRHVSSVATFPPRRRRGEPV